MLGNESRNSMAVMPWGRVRSAPCSTRISAASGLFSDEGVLQERASSDEAGVDVGAAFEERFHDFRIHPGIKKGCHAVTVAGVDIGAAFNEEPDNFWLFGHGGVMERRHLGMVFHIDAAARSQTLAYAADIAFLCGPEKVVLVGFSG